MTFGELTIQMLVYRAYLRGYRLTDNIDRQCLCVHGSSCQIVQAAIDLAFAFGVTDRAAKKDVRTRELMNGKIIKHLGLPDGEATEVSHK